MYNNNDTFTSCWHTPLHNMTAQKVWTQSFLSLIAEAAGQTFVRNVERSVKLPFEPQWSTVRV